MKPILPLAASLLGVSAAPLSPQARAPRSELPRLILYHQTTHDATGRPISLLPLITKQHIALTHLIVGALHVHANGTIHLNDHPPSHARFATLWNETRILQQPQQPSPTLEASQKTSGGIKILAMLGGAARGSFSPSTLDAPPSAPATFERAYGLLRDTITAHRLDGVDLDVEEHMSQAGIARLVERLRADFGAGFVVCLAPVASALVGGGGGNLSGFDYGVLERGVGRRMVGWYNAQFYNGFGEMGGTAGFDRVVASGWDPRRVVVGQLTHPGNGGAGFVRHEVLGRTVEVLRRRYGEIGGVAGWEYFNGAPGGVGEPWRWAEVMTRVLRPGEVPRLGITREVAERLERAWVVSAAAAGVVGPGERVVMSGAGAMSGIGNRNRTMGLWPNVDYMGMVNE